MSDKQLGRLQKVELREAWLSEANHFTPWLAQGENLKLLGEAIGIQLECEAQEKNVGPFRADILCKDSATSHWVLIENQLERTDHNHLGQLLTYAAGLEAVTIVWIAQRFTDEHRAALDWLNQHTDEGINFFGLEVELWRIGKSPFAPKFNVVCKPNEWTRSIAESARNTELSQSRHNYWLGFKEQPLLKPILTAPIVPTRKGNQTIPTYWRAFKLSAFVSHSYKSIGIYLSCQGDEGAANLHQLRGIRLQIEATLTGGELLWEEDQNKGWITWRFPENDPARQSDWPRQHKLLAEKAVAFYNCLDPHIRKLEE